MSATWQLLLLGQFHKSKAYYANGGIKGELRLENNTQGNN